MSDMLRPAQRAAALSAQIISEPISELDSRLSVKDEIALSDANVRRNVALWIMLLFAIVNVFTLGVLIWLGREDQHDLVRKLITPAGRLVNKDVIIALLGATTVQLGSIAVIMARYVFKAPADQVTG
jgi:hypothetical protein